MTFASSAATASLLSLEVLKNGHNTTREIIASTRGFKIDPPSLFVLPAGLALLLLGFSLVFLARDIFHPWKLYLVRWVTVGDTLMDSKRTLVGGRRVWLWGCFIGSGCQLAQIVTTGCYGRLVGGVLEWYFWGDAAFFVLFSTSVLSLLTSLHSVPLLRETSYYSPPPRLSSPIAPPFLSTSLVFFLPSALALLFVYLLVLQSIPTKNLDHLFQLSSLVLSNGTSVLVNTTLQSSFLNVHSFLPVKEVDMYDFLEKALTEGWKDTLPGMGKQARIKVLFLAVLFFLIVFIEIVVFFRYWKLVQNAKQEEKPTYTMRKTYNRPRLPASSYAASLSRYDSSSSYLPPALPHSPKLLPIFPNSHAPLYFVKHLPPPPPPPTHYEYNSSHPYNPPFNPHNPPPTPRSNQSPYTAYSSRSSPSQPSFLVPSTKWSDDVPLLRVDQEIGGEGKGDVVCLPAAAFLVKKGGRGRVDYGGWGCLPLRFDDEAEEEIIWEGSEEEKPSWEELMTEIERTCDGDLKSSAMRRGGLAYKQSQSSGVSSEESGSSFTVTASARSRDLSRGGRTAVTCSKGGSSQGRTGSSGGWATRMGDTERCQHQTQTDWSQSSYYDSRSSGLIKLEGRHVSQPRAVAMSRYKSNDSFTTTTSAASSAPSDTSSSGLLLKASRGGYRGPSSECLRALGRSRVKDAIALLGVLVIYGAVLQVQASFTEQVQAHQKIWTIILLASHLLPLLSTLIILLFITCRALSASTDKNLYSRTRWGKKLDREGWWIPTDSSSSAMNKGLEEEEKGGKSTKREGPRVG